MELDFNLEGIEKVQVYPTKVTEKPLVSVCVQTYKHEKYIKQCLDGILMQQTNFEFEILLGEDDSPDKTREICIEYADKYPDKIRLFLHDRSNVIYINGNPTGRYNFIYNLINANGKYIALCEGDDYWTDALKLQKQVDFLENNSDYGLVHTDNDILYDYYGEVKTDINKTSKINIPTGYIYDQLLLRNTIRTLTVLFRSKYLNKIRFEEFKNFKMGDYPLWLEISQESKIGYLTDTTSIYRLRKNSASNFSDIKSHYKFQLEVYKIKLYYIDKCGCQEDTKKVIYKNFNKLNLDVAYTDINKGDAKKFYKKLKKQRVNTVEIILKYYGSFSLVSNILVNYILRLNKKISLLFK